MAERPVCSVGAFLDRVSRIRRSWGLGQSDKELWFRGESKEYVTMLRPVLYRPPSGREMASVVDLLAKEERLYKEFQRCAVQLSNGQFSLEDWEWDSYFLMQHHNAPTRLLDWSDGALMALHFALRTKE